MKWRGLMLAMVPVVLYVPAYATVVVVVGEYSGHYQRGPYPIGDYNVFEDSIITIFRYDPGYPYDFDCYDDATPEPHTPADIQAITVANFVGDIEVNIFEHENRTAGAANVLVFFPHADAATVTIGRLHILGVIGQVPNFPSYLDKVKWYFKAATLVNDLHVTSLEGGFFMIDTLSANLYVDGTGLEHYTSLRIGHLDSPYHVDVMGSLLGDVILGVVADRAPLLARSVSKTT